MNYYHSLSKKRMALVFQHTWTISSAYLQMGGDKFRWILYAYLDV
jgi:hypothetical protein